MTRLTFVMMLVACGGDDGGPTPDASTTTGEYTLATCTTNIASDVPEPYSLFRCVDVALEGTNVVITTTGLPPHRTYYYGASSPNYEAWDDRGGLYQPNPNMLVRTVATFAIPLAPVARNVTITSALVDGVVNTSGSEYRQGPAGVALDSVLLFNPLAAPGDDIADEQYTFDPYNAHPAPGGQYHYHRDSIGPAEVRAETYGVMCDGTFVLGCTELDGATPVQTDLDAQNGHVHEVAALGARYHVHLCPTWADHPRPYTPEIQYYDSCTIR